MTLLCCCKRSQLTGLRYKELDLEVRRQQVFAVELVNHFYGLSGVVHDVNQVHILRADVTLHFQHDILNPLKQAFPVGAAYQYNREGANFFRLDKRDRLKQFVERTESARHHNKSLRILHKHYFAHKEVVKVDELVRID